MDPAEPSRPAGRAPWTDAPNLPPLPAEPVVSVVIPVRDGAASLPEAVTSALAQRPAPAEVVIAVGPSDDGTLEVAHQLAAGHPGAIKVVDNPSGRTAEALNTAIAHARGQVLARVDAGSQLPDGYLARAVEVLGRTRAANVGGVQVPDADHGFAAAVAAAMRSPWGTGGAAYRSGARDGPVDTVYLGVFRREALDAVGGFDPAFVRNQDAELNVRLREAGYTVWLDPELRVRYQPRSTVRGLASQYLQYGRWRRANARAHPGSLQPRQLAPVVLVGGLLAAVGWSLVRRSAAPSVLAGGSYLGGVAAAGGHAAPDARRWPATTLALATMHLSWGVGFLLGPPREVGRGVGDRRPRAVGRGVDGGRAREVWRGVDGGRACEVGRGAGDRS